MKNLFVTSIFVLYSALLIGVTRSQPDTVNVCCYSNNPDQYTPKCYPCLKVVYTNALQACVNATEMPKNISYNAATCMEKNCMIELPTPPTTSLDTAKSSPLWDLLSLFMNPGGARQRRSSEDNRVDGQNIPEEVFTFVDGRQIVFGEPEYS